MVADGQQQAAIRALSWATDIDVLPPDRILERRDGHWVIRSPSNPSHFWGNFLLFEAAPQPGDVERWEAAFTAELGAGVRHRAFGWDTIDGSVGAASEFVEQGYDLERTVGLIARPDELLSHPRENRDVVVRALNPTGGDDQLWEQVIELQVAARDPRDALDLNRDFCRARIADLKALFREGRGAWFVALGDERGGGTGQVLGSLGIVVTGSRARYQTVDTVASHRRRGICSRLVVESARRCVSEHRIEHLVICADPAYHALGLYESLGFRRAELVAGLLKRA